MLDIESVGSKELNIKGSVTRPFLHGAYRHEKKILST